MKRIIEVTAFIEFDDIPCDMKFEPDDITVEPQDWDNDIGDYTVTIHQIREAEELL